MAMGSIAAPKNSVPSKKGLTASLRSNKEKDLNLAKGNSAGDSFSKYDTSDKEH